MDRINGGRYRVITFNWGEGGGYLQFNSTQFLAQRRRTSPPAEEASINFQTEMSILRVSCPQLSPSFSPPPPLVQSFFFLFSFQFTFLRVCDSVDLPRCRQTSLNGHLARLPTVENQKQYVVIAWNEPGPTGRSTHGRRFFPSLPQCTYFVLSLEASAMPAAKQVLLRSSI